MIICSRCGAQNLDNASKCDKCGAKLLVVTTEPKRVKPIITSISRKPTIKSADSRQMVAPEAVRRGRPVAPPGMCFYHHQLTANYVCGRCGRSICTACALPYGSLVFCPHCRPF